MAELHLQAHGGDVTRSLAAIPADPSTLDGLADLDDPDLGGTLGLVSSARASGSAATMAEVHAHAHAGPSDGQPGGTASGGGLRFHPLRPHARGGLGAVFVALDASCTARWRSSRSSTSTPTTRPAAPGSCSRPRSPAAWSTRASSPSTGWAPTPTAGPTTPCGSSAATASRRRSTASTPTRRWRSDPGRRSLELRKLLRRFIDVCNAIDYAHSRGVLHRDIKPGNVIVGKHGETLVVDWGLAKALGQADPGSANDSGERTLMPSSASGSAETLPGRALGTPGFMSPEQAEGDLEHLGPRSDVYSLGATLYYLLTGRPPVEGKSSRSSWRP